MPLKNDNSAIESYLSTWTQDSGEIKAAFNIILEQLKSKGDTSLSFKDRPGVCHSLRATRAGQEWRPYFILVDVIDDDPTDRWLSVCFYADMINDPDEIGDFVPQGIKNLDGYCFDVVEGYEEGFLEYLAARIEEAYVKAENL